MEFITLTRLQLSGTTSTFRQDLNIPNMDTPGQNPLADVDPPSQIWTPLPNCPFKHRLYHIW